MGAAIIFYYLWKLLLIYFLLILLNVAFTWFRLSPYNRRWAWLVRPVRAVTEPLLNPIREALMPLTWKLGGIDLSPLVLWLLLWGIYSLLYAIVVR
ncbi:MAG: YggT family protein [Armatimonadota bacterium]